MVVEFSVNTGTPQPTRETQARKDRAVDTCQTELYQLISEHDSMKRVFLLTLALVLGFAADSFAQTGRSNHTCSIRACATIRRDITITCTRDIDFGWLVWGDPARTVSCNHPTQSGLFNTSGEGGTNHHITNVSGLTVNLNNTSVANGAQVPQVNNIVVCENSTGTVGAFNAYMNNVLVGGVLPFTGTLGSQGFRYYSVGATLASTAGLSITTGRYCGSITFRVDYDN